MIEYTIRELECFHAVAEELNFTRAAERLHLSQPPLSRHIRELERRLGSRLFERDRRSVSVTASGRLFRSETRGVLEQLTRAQERVRDQASGTKHRLEIAFVGALLSDQLVETLKAYQKQVPEVGLTLHDSTPSDQLEALSRGLLDIGFIGPAPREVPRGVELRHWRSEALYVLLPNGHPWSEWKNVPFSELEGQSLVTVSAEAAPAYNQWLQELFVSADIRPLFVQRADRARAVCSMVAVSGNVGLLIQSACHLAGGCNALPVTKKGQTIELPLVLAYRPSARRQAERLTGDVERER